MASIIDPHTTENTLVLDADGTFIPLFTDDRLVIVLKENIKCNTDRIQWVTNILNTKFSTIISLVLPKIQKMNLKKNPTITVEECFNIKVNDLINTGIISSAGGIAFEKMLVLAYQIINTETSVLNNTLSCEIDKLIADINTYKHNTSYGSHDWWFTPEINRLYLKACAELDEKLLEIIGWEKYAEILIRYALLDDIAYPESSLLEYYDSKLNKLNDTCIINHALWTTYIITKGIFDTYGSLENYKALRHIIKNQTKWKSIVIWTLSLYGEQLGMLLGIDIVQSFDTLKLRNGTTVSKTDLTHQDERDGPPRFTVYNKKSEKGLKRFYEVSQIEPNMAVLVDDTSDNVKNFKLGYLVNKLLPSNATKFNIGGEYFNYLVEIINGVIPIPIK